LDPAFSPDGQILAFIKQTRPGGGIYTVPVSGGEEQRVISDGKDHWGLAWTPDGRDIVFANASYPIRMAGALFQEEGTTGWLWKIPLRGGEPERLLFGQEGIEPSIQGNRLVYVRQRANLNIWRRRLDSLLSASAPDKLISSTPESIFEISMPPEIC
jgi:Tol biopolymer transport system component